MGRMGGGGELQGGKNVRGVELQRGKNVERQGEKKGGEGKEYF